MACRAVHDGHRCASAVCVFTVLCKWPATHTLAMQMRPAADPCWAPWCTQSPMLPCGIGRRLRTGSFAVASQPLKHWLGKVKRTG